MKTTLLIVAFFLLATAMPPEGVVNVVSVYPGLNGPHPAGSPAGSVDTMGGVGPKHLVDFHNGGVVVRSKTDGKELQPRQTQRQFWEAALKYSGAVFPGNPYDPRILFDPPTSRWFAIADVWPSACCGPYILVGVSRDEDPTNPWKAVILETRVPVDNVKLGLDKNGLYTTEFGANTGQPPQGALLAIPKADLLWRGDSAPSLAHVNRLELDPMPRLTDNKLRGIEGVIPVIDLDAKKKKSDPEFCVNRYRREVDGETILQVRKITWQTPVKAALSEPVDIGLVDHYPVQPFTRAVQPALPGALLSPGLAAGEGRLVNVALNHDSLWTTAATGINKRTAAFWAEINLKTMKLVQHGVIAEPEADFLFPSLSVDGRGNLGVAVMRSSANEAASTYVTGRLHEDPPNQLRPLVRAVQGQHPYLWKTSDLTKPNQGVPTSDYATTILDPVDSTLFWSYQFAAMNDCLPKEENGGKYAVNWVAFRVGGAAGKRK